MCYNLARLDADVRTIINQKQNTKASPAPGSARKSHNADCWLAINGVKATVAGAADQEAIRIEVNFIRRAGMYVILDLHWSAPGGQLALSQNPAPDEDHSVEFWRQLAGSYRSDTGLIFDIFNEPYDYWGKNSDHCAAWLNGDPYSQWR